MKELNETKTKFRDPGTNMSVPQYCRLLIPDFSLMVKIWNSQHHKLNEQISNSIVIKLKVCCLQNIRILNQFYFIMIGY